MEDIYAAIVRSGLTGFSAKALVESDLDGMAWSGAPHTHETDVDWLSKLI